MKGRKTPTHSSLWNQVPKKFNKKIVFTVILTILAPISIFAYYISPKEEAEKAPTEITYQGATSGQYSDIVSLEAKLVAKVTQEGLEGKNVTFSLEAQEISAVTNEQGIAKTDLVLNQGAGDYTILTFFGGDEYFSGSSDADSFKILKENTSLTYTGPLSAGSGSTVTLKAQLSELDEEIGDLSGKRIIFKSSTLSVSGITNSQGRAEVEVYLTGIPAATYTLTTEFQGDALYLPSSDTDIFKVTTGGGGGGCFIATAAFGSPLASEIVIIRKFRDQYLLQNSLGRLFVEKYYKYSPPLAEFIAGHENLKKLVRIGLEPVIKGIKLLFY